VLSVAICDTTTATMTINASASAISKRLLRMLPRLGLGIALPIRIAAASERLRFKGSRRSQVNLRLIAGDDKRYSRPPLSDQRWRARETHRPLRPQATLDWRFRAQPVALFAT
jgi:hypothetical protein